MTLVEPRPAPPVEEEEGGGWLTPSRVGWAGVVLACLAFFVALPPILIRSPIPSVILGLAGIAAGDWATRQGEKRLGRGAVAASLVGIALGHRRPRSRARRTSSASSSGRRCWRRCCATPRRCCSPRSAACSPSAAASSTSGSRA